MTTGAANENVAFSEQRTVEKAIAYIVVLTFIFFLFFLLVVMMCKQASWKDAVWNLVLLMLRSSTRIALGDGSSE